MPTKQQKKLNEYGFASIVIALVLIIVLGLLTVGFAQLARREQKNTLDKQLANQAYYAAESGINDVIKALPAISSASTPPDKDTCLDSAQLSSFGLNPAVDTSRGVSYQCVLVNPTPPDIRYDNIGPQSDRYITFSTEPDGLTSLTVKWGSADGHNTYTNATSGFKPSNQWGNAPAVVQFTVTPIDPGNVNRSALDNNAFTAYLYPSTVTGSVNYTTATSGKGKVVPGGCSGTGVYPCSVTIGNLPGTPGATYLLHILPQYDQGGTNIDISGKSGSTIVKFIDAQAVIDVTGKAQDVLKRLRVVVPFHANYSSELPDGASESQNACKRFTTDPLTPAGFDTALSSSCNLSN